MSKQRHHTLGRVLAALLLPVSLATSVLAEGPTVSGFVDFGYNYNFNGMTTNTLRTFDANANSLTVQNAEIVVDGKTDKGVAYRVDVDHGFDAANIHSAGYITGAGNTQIDLQQAFVSYPCPWTGGNVTVGKFVTLHGVEVIEAKDNYNISRGLLFNYAIPFTHTGVKYDKGFMDGKLNFAAALVNGWDNMTDNNKGKTVHGMVNVVPHEKVSLTVGGTHGPEQTSPAGGPSTEKNARSLVDTILKVTATDKLTLIANHDWGVEEGLAPAGTDTTQNWGALGLHANYLFNETCSAALRWETFDDEGSRTGAEQVLNSLTATLQHKKDDVTYRLEYRQDGSSKKPYVDSDGLADDSQSTVGAQVIYSF
jgi:hypothetical protein